MALFTSPRLEFRDANGQPRRLAYRDIAEVQIELGAFLAEASPARIRTMGGQVVNAKVAQGELAIDRFGVVQTHRLRNLRRIVPGVARLRYRNNVPSRNRHAAGSKMRPMPASSSACK
jgi:hypothetical protein